VWGAKGVHPHADVASYGERYDRATTWIVCYRRERPVGVLGVVDMRVASMALDYGRRIAPLSLRLDRTRELGRLAILPEHRGGAQLVLVGMFVQMYRLVQALGTTTLFAGSIPALYRVYRRFCPSLRLVSTAVAPSEDPVQARYLAPLRAYGGEDVVYAVEVAALSPWNVISRCVACLLGKGR
jgi:hypothetical protein